MPKRNIQKYITAYKKRFIEGKLLKIVGLEMGLTDERVRVMAKWVKNQLKNPMCRLKEIRELREKIKKTAKIRQKSNTKKK